jgi:hypothetical protein
MPFKNQPPYYNVWASMHDRCRNPNFRQWNRYGGRGIKVCERWNDYSAFAADMGPRPEGYSLDRIDNDGDYSPENCRWADRKTQQMNTSAAVFVEIDGVKYRAIELSREYGVKTDTIVNRAKLGLSFSDVVSAKKRVFKEGLALGGAANGARQKAKTHCPKGHTYDDAIISKQGFRRCRTCFYAKERERRAKRAMLKKGRQLTKETPDPI